MLREGLGITSINPEYKEASRRLIEESTTTKFKLKNSGFFLLNFLRESRKEIINSTVTWIVAREPHAFRVRALVLRDVLEK